jgi:hypothetical protein
MYVSSSTPKNRKQRSTFEPKSPDIPFAEWERGRTEAQTDALRPPPSGNRLKIPEVTHRARNDTPSGTPGNSTRMDDLIREVQAKNLLLDFMRTDRAQTPPEVYKYLRGKSPIQPHRDSARATPPDSNDSARATPPGSEAKKIIRQMRKHYKKVNASFAVLPLESLETLAERELRLVGNSHPEKSWYSAITDSAENLGCPLDPKLKNKENFKDNLFCYTDYFKGSISQYREKIFGIDPDHTTYTLGENAWYNKVKEALDTDCFCNAVLCVLALCLGTPISLFNVITGNIQIFTGKAPWDRKDTQEKDPIHIAFKTATFGFRYSSPDKKFTPFEDDSLYVFDIAVMKKIDLLFLQLCIRLIKGMDDSSKNTEITHFQVSRIIVFLFKKSRLGQELCFTIKCCNDVIILEIFPYQNISELLIGADIWHSRNGDVKDVTLILNGMYRLKGYVCEDGQTMTLEASPEEVKVIHMLINCLNVRE